MFRITDALVEAQNVKLITGERYWSYFVGYGFFLWN